MSEFTAWLILFAPLAAAAAIGLLIWPIAYARASRGGAEGRDALGTSAGWLTIGAVGRAPCPRCRCSRKFYCYTCYEVVGMDPKLVPKVQLPVKVDMYVYRVRGGVVN